MSGQGRGWMRDDLVPWVTTLAWIFGILLALMLLVQAPFGTAVHGFFEGAFGGRLAMLVPGIRLAGGDAHDQRRVMTPAAAQAAGARYLILGRAVTAAPDAAAAMSQVLAELG